MSNPSNAPGGHGTDPPVERAHDQSGERPRAAELLQADRLAGVGALAAGLAHEINNPLTYALYNMESMMDDLGGIEALCSAGEGDEHAVVVRLRERLHQLEDFRERLEAAVEGIRRVRDLVHDLETFSSVHSDRLVQFELRPVLDSTLRLTGTECRHRARVVTEYQETPQVLGSPARLAQVFFNLVVNAAQSIPEGHQDENEIRVVLSSERRQVVVEVRDTGEGIPPEQLKRVFDPFFTTKPIGIGSGLGLSVCHNIVAAHGGSLEVESQPAQGSCFRVRLPASEERQDEVEAAPVSSAPGRRLRVLVVDDEPEVGKALRRMLSCEHDVTVLRSGVQARSTLRQQTFDVIVCDLMMPNLSGMDLYDEISREEPELARRFVFMTGGAFTERARRFVERIGNICLGKPFKPDELRRAVARCGRNSGCPE